MDRWTAHSDLGVFLEHRVFYAQRKISFGAVDNQMLHIVKLRCLYSLLILFGSHRRADWSLLRSHPGRSDPYSTQTAVRSNGEMVSFVITTT